MFFLLTQKMIRKFTKQAHESLKATSDPRKMNFFQIFLLKRRGFERHHYRIGARRLAMF